MSNQETLLEKWDEWKYKYNLVDWYLYLDYTNKRFGRCNFSKKRIDISVYHLKLNTEYQVLRTLLHEIAHAITKQGHTNTWLNKFQALLNIELNSDEVVNSRFGKGILPSTEEKKKFNQFELKV